MAAAGSSSAPIDLESTDEDEPEMQQSMKRPKTAVSTVTVERLTLPQGILDESILKRVDAIAQQENCVGCDGRGLAEALAKKLTPAQRLAFLCNGKLVAGS